MIDHLADPMFHLASRHNVADAALALANARIAYRCAFEELKVCRNSDNAERQAFNDASRKLEAYEEALFNFTEITDDMVRSTYARNAAFGL